MSEYHSKYCKDKKVTAAQYIAELVCENIAAQESKGLPLQFWKGPEWKKIFAWQVILANRLLKDHTASAIIKSLRTYKGKKAISLNAGFILKPLIKKFEAEEKLVRPNETVIPMKTDCQPRQRKAKKNLLEMLDE